MSDSVAAPTGSAAPAAELPAPATIDAGKRANRRVGIRVLIYMVATHGFAGFIMLLSEIGSRKG
jgi:hypothetical protein